MNTNKDLPSNRSEMVNEAVVAEETVSGKMASEERAVLEAAVEKIKAKRAHEN
jgi:hypothetical protein